MSKRRGRRPSIDGYAIAAALVTDRPLSIAIYEQACRHQRIDEFRVRAKPCPTCERSATLQIYFLSKEGRRVGCPACVPRDRWCARCQAYRPLSEFDITPSRRLGFKLESFCQPCRRARSMAFYFEKRDIVPEPRPTRIECTRCGKRRPAHRFFQDGRYRFGAYQPCKACKRQLEQEHYETPDGKVARDRATARYNARTGRRGRRS